MPNVSDWQRQVLLGTVLGGSSIKRINKNCHLSMRGSNKRWLDYKAQELEFMEAENPYTMDRENYYRWHSACSPYLNGLYDLFYEGGKKRLRPEVLDGLRDIGLAGWFLDAGKIARGRATVGVRSFGEDGARVAGEYFGLLGMENEAGRTGVTLTGEATGKFLGIIGAEVPDFMSDRLRDSA